MNYVKGYTTNESVYTKKEASSYFKEQSNATQLPFIFLSAGVAPQLSQEKLRFVSESDSTFNSVLCGIATWGGVTEGYSEENEKAKGWLNATGVNNINNLNDLVNKVATSIK